MARLRLKNRINAKQQRSAAMTPVPAAAAKNIRNAAAGKAPCFVVPPCMLILDHIDCVLFLIN
jgi:hypothetical protein